MQQGTIRYRVMRSLALCTAMTALSALSLQLQAQQFQFHSGSNSCREAGRGGVLQLPGGGYVAVGETFSGPTGCATSDIFVVRINANGTVNWSGQYNIGGNDSATSVIRHSINGDLYICGVTANTGGCTATRDGFIMRVSINTGAVVGIPATLGSTRDEILYDLVETRTGGGGTNIGDIVAVGTSTLNAGTGRDGWIVRLTAALGFVWSRTYGAGGSADDYFFSVDEALAGAPADIIAVGGTTTFGAGLGDVLVARLNGATGMDGAAPQNIAVFGGARLDEGRSVRTIRVGAAAGEIIITGNTNSRPAPSTNSEGFILHLQSDPCLMQVCDLYFGDDGGGFDNGRCIREIPVGAPAGFTVGNYAVTGTTPLGNSMVSGNNVYLQQFSPACATVGTGMAYGGNGFDEGWSVNIAVNNVATQQSPGFIIAGYTQSSSLIGTDPQQLYMIKTSITMPSGCNETGIQFSTEAAGFARACVTMVSITFPGPCMRGTTMVPVSWGWLLCFTAAPATRQRENGNDGVSGVESPVIGMDASGAVFYPNPVTSGMPLNLRFTARKDADVAIVVSDLAGRVVYQHKSRYDAGTAVYALNTAGWASGNYLVSIQGEGVTSVARVVTVLDAR